jgi:UDP-glucose 4-epimerase
MARVVVTGGAGFIGSHIVDALLRDAHHVEVIDDLSSGFESNLPKGVKLHTCDIRSEKARSILQNIDPDTVVHTAAQISVRVSMEDPRTDTDLNVVGLVNLLQAFMGRRKQPHFVFLSSGGAIYGEQSHFPATETHPIQPASIYGLAKRVSEMYLEFWERSFGIGYTALRLANVYGPRQNPHGEAGVVAIFCERMLKKEIPTINGTGEQTRDFVFVTDVAEAARRVVKDRVVGVFNIGTGKESSVNDVYRHIASALKISESAQFGAAKSGEQMRSVIDPAHAGKTFGWKPTVALDGGLAKTAEWFRHPVRD